MALEQDRGNVGDVPMADVGGENWLQACAHRIAACVECAIDAQVVGLAAEVKLAEIRAKSCSSRTPVCAHSSRSAATIVTLDTFVVSPR